MRKPRSVADESQVTTNDNATVTMDKTGLYIFGKIVNRTRRRVPKINPTTEVVTYTLEDEAGRKNYVEDFAPSTYHELGEYVTFHVYVKAYIKKNREASYTLNILKDIEAVRGGEPF